MTVLGPNKCFVECFALTWASLKLRLGGRMGPAEENIFFVDLFSLGS